MKILKKLQKNYKKIKNIFKRIPSLNIGNLVSPNKKIMVIKQYKNNMSVTS